MFLPAASEKEEVHFMAELRSNKLVNFPSPKTRGAEGAIAREVAAHLCVLNALCAYVGWSSVAQHLNRAEDELNVLVKQKHLDCVHKISDGNN
jgi:hypothetical protein